MKVSAYINRELILLLSLILIVVVVVFIAIIFSIIIIIIITIIFITSNLANTLALEYAHNTHTHNAYTIHT